MQPGDFEKSEPFKEAKNLTKFVLILKKSKEYKKLLLQTENYLQFCKKQWEGNYKYSSEVIKELTGFNLNKQFTVFITHPSLRNGRYLGNNRIAWGHYEDWSNYATVYLWHEILHSYLTFSDKDHAIIQLIADNELRIKLNKEKCLPLKGHKELFLLMKKMHPKWKKYTIARRKNFKELCKSLPSKP